MFSLIAAKIFYFLAIAPTAESPERKALKDIMTDTKLMPDFFNIGTTTGVITSAIATISFSVGIVLTFLSALVGFFGNKDKAFRILAWGLALATLRFWLPFVLLLFIR